MRDQPFCAQLGVFGRKVRVPSVLCGNGLHERTGRFCYECQRLTQRRAYWRRMLMRYWATV